MTVIITAWAQVQLFSQASSNLISNPSFESGQANKPDNWGQLSPNCANWMGVWSPDWHTTKKYGTNNHDKNRGIDGFVNGSWQTWQTGNLLKSPFSGEYFVGIGKCEAIYLRLDDNSFEPGCEYNISFRIAARAFVNPNNIWQSNNNWVDEINLHLLSGAPPILTEGDNPCYLNIRDIEAAKYSFSFTRGMYQGSSIDDFTSNQWLEVSLTNILWTEEFKYLMIRLPNNGSEGWGQNNRAYYYFDDFRVALNSLEDFAESAIVITQDNDSQDPTYTSCDEIVTYSNYENYPKFNGLQTLTAKNAINLLPKTHILPSSIENEIHLRIDGCMNCPSVLNTFEIDQKLCLCADDNEGNYSIYPQALVLSPPIPTLANNTYTWSSSNTNIVLTSMANNQSIASLPSSVYAPNSYLQFYFYFNEYNSSNVLVNTYVVKYYAYNECTKTELEEVMAPSDCGQGIESEKSTWVVGDKEYIHSEADYSKRVDKFQRREVRKVELYDTTNIQYKDTELDSRKEDSYQKMELSGQGGNSQNIIEIYPNPTKNSIIISCSENFGYTLHKTSGETLLSGMLMTGLNTLDLSEFSSGIYYLRIDEQIFKVVKL